MTLRNLTILPLLTLLLAGLGALTQIRNRAVAALALMVTFASLRGTERTALEAVLPQLLQLQPLLQQGPALPQRLAPTAQTQQRRLQERGWTTEQMRQRIAAQWPTQHPLHF